MAARLSCLTPFLLLVSFFLLLFVTLSIPIIHTIDLLRLKANIDLRIAIFDASASGDVKFGVWGYCVSAVHASAFGQTINEPASCSKPRLGYTFDKTVANALQVEDIESDLNSRLSSALVMHPIVCALAFLSFVQSIVVHFRPTRLNADLAVGSIFNAALLTTVVFLVDVIFVAVVRHKIHKSTEGAVSATWGNATWMALAAAVLLWIATVGSCFGCFHSRRQQRKSGTY